MGESEKWLRQRSIILLEKFFAAARERPDPMQGSEHDVVGSASTSKGACIQAAKCRQFWGELRSAARRNKRENRLIFSKDQSLWEAKLLSRFVGMWKKFVCKFSDVVMRINIQRLDHQVSYQALKTCPKWKFVRPAERND